MERYEVILKLYDYYPDVDRYKCDVCGRLYKTVDGVYRHIENQHNQQINELRNE